jgi:hypothetical protein
MFANDITASSALLPRHGAPAACEAVPANLNCAEINVSDDSSPQFTPKLSPTCAIVAPVEMRYAYATGFTDDLLRGRQPIDKQEARVSSAVRCRLCEHPLTLRRIATSCICCSDFHSARSGSH